MNIGPIILGLVAGIGMMAAPAAARADDDASDAGAVARGGYLAKAGDCAPCHTGSRDKSYAGGLRINTPFGAIYSPNITPDPETGIGKWTFEDFRNAVHAGIRADGQYLYPTMPFDAFVKITDDDLRALWAYFRSLPPIRQANRDNEMSFPFNIRDAMLVWRWMYFDERPFSARADKSAQWNRGAYLVEALAHCGDCHTPRNFMGATIARDRFRGARIDQWYAPDITPEQLVNGNQWDKARMVAFLKQGAASNSTALGPMQEVVHDSLASLTADDLDAMATYLLDVPKDDPPPKATPVARLAPEVERYAGKLYADNCASCHQANGQGVAGSVPPLAGNPAVVAAKPYDVLAAVLQGLPAHGTTTAMPAFAGSLNDEDVANVANYVRTNWGNAAVPSVTPELVATWRSSLSLPLYGDDAARAFDCPNIGPGGDPQLDPALTAALGREMAQRSVSYARIVELYRAQNPNAKLTDIVNGLVAAYCPVVAQGAASAQAKSLALKKLAINVSAYLSDREVAAAGPEAGIVWAVPAGYSLAERDPAPQSKLTCPADDNSRVPAALVRTAAQVVGTPNPNFQAGSAAAQAGAMVERASSAKPADIANALILAFCDAISRSGGIGDDEKFAAVMRFGQEVIGALQDKAEQRGAGPAVEAQSGTQGQGAGSRSR